MIKIKSIDLKGLAEIYISFFKLGLVSFGGGYSMIPLIEREVVQNKKWIQKDKIVDIFAISESLPGAIALNSSTFVGYSVARIPGALAALLGNMTPSVIIILTLSILFQQISTYPLVKSAFRGIYPAIVGLIVYAAFKIGKQAVIDIKCLVIMILAFCAAMFFHISPVLIILSGGVAGIAISLPGYINRSQNNDKTIKIHKNADNGLNTENKTMDTNDKTSEEHEVRGD